MKLKYNIALAAAFGFSLIAGTSYAQQATQQPVQNALPVINALQPVTYQFDAKKYPSLKLTAGSQYGFAQTPTQVPGLLTEKNIWHTAGKNQQVATSVSTANHEVLIPLLVSAIQEQQAEIKQLREEVRRLSAK
ncbi:tail fiber domain-containing protein [Mucilaginibacter terrenus]|uniref:Tail fiber domain-containing protein n=1 Tax=Mucilaginibacter terrenus TaxID=2482727 RepID=A0A3E2NWL7_9SPHI|nr:tail fiber domain-containing protein [Mucilaginibacter terrenus]RFZ85403.1 tail fiber domain-containing protein [Mucilaginibacter terrenus]